jgi:hypothetical protein
MEFNFLYKCNISNYILKYFDYFEYFAQIKIIIFVNSFIILIFKYINYGRNENILDKDLIHNNNNI